eukprot:5836740-Prymnesium_polylepis.1
MANAFMLQCTHCKVPIGGSLTIPKAPDLDPSDAVTVARRLRAAWRTFGGARPHVFRSMPRPDRARMGGDNAARMIS